MPSGCWPIGNWSHQSGGTEGVSEQGRLSGAGREVTRSSLYLLAYHLRELRQQAPETAAAAAGPIRLGSDRELSTYVYQQHICIPTNHRHFAPSSGEKYCDPRVCLFVCPLAYLKNHTSKFHQIFCTGYVTCGRDSVVL